MNKTKCLFVCLTAYNTTILKHVADELKDWDCWFTPIFYNDDIVVKIAKIFGVFKRALESQKKTIEKMHQLCVNIDFEAKQTYDIIVLGNDFYIPEKLNRFQPKVLVQEGWLWPYGIKRWLVANTFLPVIFAGASGSGLSKSYEFYCVASDKYKELGIKSGIPKEKIKVTGLPTLDSLLSTYKQNNISKQRDEFVLLTTHPGREYFEGENRKKLLLKTRKIANKRPIIVKLHPNENINRAKKEISFWLPEAKVLINNDVNQLIADCSVLITTYSTTIYYALLLGKEVYCDYPIEKVKEFLPIQNGVSAKKIADICREAISKNIINNNLNE